MTTPLTRDDAREATKALGLVKINDLPSESFDFIRDGFGIDIKCPTCSHDLLTVFEYDDLEKVRTWTVAQLISWLQALERFPGTALEMLAQTTNGGGEYIGINDWNGMFVGIERDGYRHT